MSTGQNYKDIISLGELEHKIIKALFDLYFASLHDISDPSCDHEVNAAVYATCRTVFANAGITDHVLDIFEHIFPSLEAGR